MTQLWGGRFTEPPDELLQALNDSLPFDQRMALEDIQGSIAYARALAEAKVITAEESAALVDGLIRVRAELEQGQLGFQAGDEDIHTAVERRLTELVGEVGGKLHTGRSRNDQVATDFRLWTMNAAERIAHEVKALQVALIQKAEQHLDTVMPGYTHVQPAQPITAAHWLMSFFWMLARDAERLEAVRRHTAVLPLGSGALAGTPFAVKRQMLADELGFEGLSQNSLDAVSDRDFVAEMLFALALMGTHLSRLAEDIILYSNPNFGYVTLNDRYSTGSSLMPQKRNADPMELARGKAGRLIGTVAGFLAVLKGLPSTYNKDLQEDKEALFDSVDTVATLLPIITAIIATLQLNPEKMRAALTEDMLATDLADYLVLKGLPFRQAHHVVGQIVRQGRALSSFAVAELQQYSALFTDDVIDVFDFDRSVQRRNSVGGTAPDAVRQQIAQAKRLIETD
ncbi:MAG: argininosuccinate lyase [Anaerolineae bacterium]